MTLNEAIATRIDDLLHEQNITQYRLAIKSGVCAQNIDAIRHQRNRYNAVNIIYELAVGFGMTLKEFFDDPLFSYENITD